ncbi:hypothetical protein PR048_022427 [Dryococelus australis]|uniref:Pseudouridine synthase RsuA/RluA-like domain-containing protein n=1 Tax=Dryococelus australis TaxID=614101 RepID=A0ABQ9H0Y1_9NEOP|nr:hypothetical protein PR048_022427 [Dryococelus australis]
MVKYRILKSCLCSFREKYKDTDRHDGNTARLARRSDEALGVRVSVARIAPSLLDLGRGIHRTHNERANNSVYRKHTFQDKILRWQERRRTASEQVGRHTRGDVQWAGDEAEPRVARSPVKRMRTCISLWRRFHEQHSSGTAFTGRRKSGLQKRNITNDSHLSLVHVPPVRNVLESSERPLNFTRALARWPPPKIARSPAVACAECPNAQDILTPPVVFSSGERMGCDANTSRRCQLFTGFPEVGQSGSECLVPGRREDRSQKMGEEGIHLCSYNRLGIGSELTSDAAVLTNTDLCCRRLSRQHAAHLFHLPLYPSPAHPRIFTSYQGVSEEIRAALNIEVFRAYEGGVRGEGNGRSRENPLISGIVRHDSQLRRSGVSRPGIEPGSPWWEASELTTRPPRHPLYKCDYALKLQWTQLFSVETPPRLKFQMRVHSRTRKVGAVFTGDCVIGGVAKPIAFLVGWFSPVVFMTANRGGETWPLGITSTALQFPRHSSAASRFQQELVRRFDVYGRRVARVVGEGSQRSGDATPKRTNLNLDTFRHPAISTLLTGRLYRCQESGVHKGDIGRRINGPIALTRKTPCSSCCVYECSMWGRCGVVVRLIASHLGEPGYIPGRCRWSASFLGDLPFRQPLHSSAAPHSPRFTLIGSQDLDVKSCPNPSTLLVSARAKFNCGWQHWLRQPQAARNAREIYFPANWGQRGSIKCDPATLTAIVAAGDTIWTPPGVTRQQPQRHNKKKAWGGKSAVPVCWQDWIGVGRRGSARRGTNDGLRP